MSVSLRWLPGRRLVPALLSTTATVLICLPGPASAAPPARHRPNTQYPIPNTPLAVPLEVLKTGHVTVQVMVNGKGPFRLVFDTGSPITFLRARAALAAGLIDEKTAQSPGFLGLRGQAVVKQFDVGAPPWRRVARATDLRVMVLDHPIVEMIGQVAGPLDGIVGYSFFGRFRTTLDYQAKQLTLAPGSHTPQDVMLGILRRVAATPAKRVIAPAALWGIALEAAGDPPGVTVKQVYPNTAAAVAGLRAGDRITAIAGRWIFSETDCYEAAALVRPGQFAAVTVDRAGQPLSLRIRPRLGL